MSKNFSYTYLLPLLSEQINLKKEILTFVLNTYITTNKDSYNRWGKFYILCKFNYSDTNFTRLEGYLTSNDLYVTSHEINDLILYEYNFPEIYIYEQKKFIQGKYSEFKKDTKKLILEFWADLYGHIPSFVTSTLLKIKQILNKDDRLRVKMNKELKINIEKGSELGNKIDEIKEKYIFEDEVKELQLKDLKNVFD